MEVDKILKERYEALIKYHENVANENLAIAENYRKGLELLSNPVWLNGAEKAYQASKAINEGNAKAGMDFEKFAIVDKANERPSQKETSLKNIVINYIKELDSPVPAFVLRARYNTLLGKDISINNFSPRLAELRKNGVVATVTIPNKPIKEKFMYALPSMVENKKLKPEYLKKAKAAKFPQPS